MATLQDILSGNFPAAQRYAEGYAQMPSYLQDPYLGLSTSQVGNVTKGLLGQTENKLLTDIEKRKPYNSFFSTYQDKLMPNSLPNTGNTFESENYMKFVNDNKPMLEEYVTSMKDKINSYSGLTEKQKAKKINDSMRDARVDVINTWKYLTEKNEILKNIPTKLTNQGLLK